jgi:hypothetical protein
MIRDFLRNNCAQVGDWSLEEVQYRVSSRQYGVGVTGQRIRRKEVKGLRFEVRVSSKE